MEPIYASSIHCNVKTREQDCCSLEHFLNLLRSYFLPIVSLSPIESQASLQVWTFQHMLTTLTGRQTENEKDGPEDP